MPRNLDRRVEVLFPIEDPKLSRYLRDMLEHYITERGNAWLMKENGSYELIRTADPTAPVTRP